MSASIQQPAYGRNKGPTVPRFWLIVFILLLAILSKFANAQSFEGEYERTLLDSAVRYERLKVAHKQIRIAHDLQSKAYADISAEYSLYRAQAKNEIQRVQDEARKARRSAFWRGFALGAAVQVLVYASITMKN